MWYLCIDLSKWINWFVHDLQPLETDVSGADSVISHLNEILDRYRKEKYLFPEVSAQDLGAMEQIKLDLMHLHKRWQSIFLWQDGPLVQAMKNGDLFLIDEISLADDSVLERLNSVLEPERKLVCLFLIIHSLFFLWRMKETVALGLSYANKLGLMEPVLFGYYIWILLLSAVHWLFLCFPAVNLELI